MMEDCFVEEVVPLSIAKVLVNKFKLKTREDVQYRVYENYEQRLQVLYDQDEPGESWTEQIRDPRKFLAAYAAMFSESEYEPGFYKSFVAHMRTRGRAATQVLLNLDLQFQQINLDVTIPHVRRLRDPLGFQAVPDGSTWDKMSDAYYQQGDLEKRVSVYVQFLEGASVSMMMDDIYGDPLNHYRAVNERIGTMISIVRDLPEDAILYFPGDGIGVGAIASIILGREYYSSEINRVGELAIRLGIIQSREDNESLKARMRPQDILICSNLSRFVDVPSYVEKVQNVVVFDAARRLYPGFRSVSVDHLLSTTIDSWRPSALAYPRATLRPIDTMAIPAMTSQDPVVVSELKHNGKFDPMSQHEAVMTQRDVVTGSEFILEERRIARDPPRASTHLQWLDGASHAFDVNFHRAYGPDGYFDVSA